MLNYNFSGSYQFVKIGLCAVKDSNLSLSDLGYLSSLELHKSNPKYEKLTKNTLLFFAEKKSQFKHLLNAGYITEHMRAAGRKNHYEWSYEISSLDVRQDPYHVVNHHSDGTVSSVRVTKDFSSTALPSDRFVKVPKELILNKDLSLAAVGLFVRMMSLKKKNDYSKTDIMQILGVKRSTFNEAWSSLSKAGFLTVIKKASQKGQVYDFFLNEKPASERFIILNGNGEILGNSVFFGHSQDVENLNDCKLDDNIKNFIKNKYNDYNFNEYSSKKASANEETKSILDQIYNQFSNESNKFFIDELNKKILNKYNKKAVNQTALIDIYRKVLSKFNSKNNEIISMNSYCLAVLNREFNGLSVSEDFIQNKFKIKELLNKPLDFILSVKSSSKKTVAQLDFNKKWLEYDFDKTGLDDLDLFDLTSICSGSYSYKCCPELIKKLVLRNPECISIFEEFENNQSKRLRESFSIDNIPANYKLCTS